MKIKILFLITALLIPLLLSVSIVKAATQVNLFQITNEGSQQTSPFIYKNLVVYTSLSDIWGYDLKTKQNFPILQKGDQQFITGFYQNLVIYENSNPDQSTDVYMYNLKTKKDTLVAGDPGSQGSGVTNGKVVAYIDGGACGSLKVYDIRRKTTEQIVNSTCHPIRISGDTIVYPVADPGGTNIAGYDLDEEESFDIATDPDFQEVPNIFGDNVAWLHRTTGAYGDPNSIVVKNLRTGEEITIYESSTDALNWPTISDKYVVWSQSSSQHVGGIMGANLKTGEVFEIQPQGSHQNSHTTPSIWKDTATWMSFRSGNGDVYGSTLKH